MSDIKLNNDLLLYTLYAPTWTAYKRDKKATAQVKQLNNVKDTVKAGNFNKQLLPDCETLTKVNSYVGAVRNEFYLRTAAWGDARGLRVGKAEHYMDMQVWFGDKKAGLVPLVDAFINEYMTEVQKAQEELQDMFHADEYPPPDVVYSRFKLDLSAVPLPNTEDIRIMSTLPDDVKDEIAARIKQDVNEALGGTVQEAFEAMYKPLAHMATTLKKYHDGTAKKLYDSVVENVRTMAEAARLMNVTGNPDVEKLAAEADKLVEGLSAKDLKESDGTQVIVGKKAQELANRIAKFLP